MRFPRIGIASALLLCAVSSQGDSQDTWSPEERAILISLQRSRMPPPRPDPSNRVAASPAAARLGKRLFNDPRFSRDGKVACATCHDPRHQFEDGRPLGIGLAQGQRRTMPLVDLAGASWFFWDGRKDSLWSQALGPMEDAKEHGGNRLRHAHLLQRHYRDDYEALFGAMPELSHLPADAGPLGSEAEKSAWQALDTATRTSMSRIYANMGKAIAAYESTLHYGDSRVDRYIAGVASGQSRSLAQLTPHEKAGLRLFIGKGQCVTCHNGPLLSDHHFHNTGVPPIDAKQPERGRAEAVLAVQADEFNCLGPFSDARPEQCEELRFIAGNDPHMVGAFKTPGLRNAALRPPYMHAGQFASIADVLRHYASSPHAAVGHSELKALRLSKLSGVEQEQIAGLLQALSGPVIESAP
jgi:cytochrome c peroxidase